MRSAHSVRDATDRCQITFKARILTRDVRCRHTPKTQKTNGGMPFGILGLKTEDLCARRLKPGGGDLQEKIDLHLLNSSLL